VPRIPGRDFKEKKGIKKMKKTMMKKDKNGD
jgi:hypothetical protein